MSKRKASAKIDGDSAKKAVPNKKTPKTLKDKILDLIAKQDTFVSLSKIKSILASEYDVEEGSANNTKINKTLKLLLDEERDDFGKIGGSYHGGPQSAAYLANEALLAAEVANQEQKKEKDAKEGPKPDLRCPYCRDWGKHDDFELLDEKEGSYVGSKESNYVCRSCGKDFKINWDNRVDDMFMYYYGPNYSKVVDNYGNHH